MNNDLSEQYLNRVYDDFSKEQMRLMATFKETLVEEGTEKSQDIQKQITFLNTLSMNILRFRNLRKKIATKGGLV
tara:strand:+ start:284 stop:508 length:225 start_codon:yes stop_codon:yes gene_type:complete